MRVKLIITLLVLVVTPSAFAQSTQKSFAILTGLAGEWRGNDTLGHRVRITFRVVSGGSALLSELVEAEQQEDMITMFHLDGARLLLTHYCSAGNQSRMEGTASADGKTITFSLIDVTNLKADQSGHMQRLVIRPLERDYHTEEWTSVENGKETTVTFHMRRMKGRV
jgi:hypothetical protein